MINPRYKPSTLPLHFSVFPSFSSICFKFFSPSLLMLASLSALFFCSNFRTASSDTSNGRWSFGSRRRSIYWFMSWGKWIQTANEAVVFHITGDVLANAFLGKHDWKTIEDRKNTRASQLHKYLLSWLFGKHKGSHHHWGNTVAVIL